MITVLWLTMTFLCVALQATHPVFTWIGWAWGQATAVLLVMLLRKQVRERARERRWYEHGDFCHCEECDDDEDGR